MFNNYIYLIASLPMLHYGTKPPFSWEKFLEHCESQLPPPDIALLKTTSIAGEYIYKGRQRVISKWQQWDRGLRNELVKIRASRKHADPLKYLREEAHAGSRVTQISQNAYKNPMHFEAEKTLDAERWHFIEELSIGHYFDIDFLLVYAHKLLILLKWEKINQADAERELNTYCVLSTEY
ncbi:MAG: DUF2764 family protein [Candidatus Omnitrophota bacterium]